MARRLGSVRSVLVASPDYLARRGAPEAPADLARHAIVFTATRPGPPEWRFAGTARPIRLAPRLIVNEVESMRTVVAAGHGIGRALSYQVADEIADGRLVRLLRAFEPPPLPVQIVLPSARHLAPRVRAFVEHAATALSRLPVIREE